MKLLLVAIFLVGSLTNGAAQADKSRDSRTAVPEIAALEPELETLYRELHEHPELAFHEDGTAETLAKRVKELGFDVTTEVGKTGLVAIMHNGPGPVVMLRTELDALPIEEKTGLPFASKPSTRNVAGVVVPVAHACGHDLHMTGWYGAAKIMAQWPTAWHGTMMLVGQPAEESFSGASAMLTDGFTRFPKPDYAISMHDEPSLQSGQVGITQGSSAPSRTLWMRRSSAAVDMARPQGGTDAVYKDPALTLRLVNALRQNLGADGVREMPAKMTSEEFSQYGPGGCPGGSATHPRGESGGPWKRGKASRPAFAILGARA